LGSCSHCIFSNKDIFIRLTSLINTSLKLGFFAERMWVEDLDVCRYPSSSSPSSSPSYIMRILISLVINNCLQNQPLSLHLQHTNTLFHTHKHTLTFTHTHTHTHTRTSRFKVQALLHLLIQPSEFLRE
jgi:hypothetical protein